VRVALELDGALRARGGVAGLEAFSHLGTPVLDVKPWMAEPGPQGPVRQPAWASELMAGYWTGAGG
jgi:tRNA (Thr-GGU) A37 N-methylase